MESGDYTVFMFTEAMSNNSVFKVCLRVLNMAVWLSGSTLALINIVALRKTQSVLGWVTVHRYTILVFNQATKAYSAWPSLRG